MTKQKKKKNHVAGDAIQEREFQQYTATQDGEFNWVDSKERSACNILFLNNIVMLHTVLCIYQAVKHTYIYMYTHTHTPPTRPLCDTGYLCVRPNTDLKENLLSRKCDEYVEHFLGEENMSIRLAWVRGSSPSLHGSQLTALVLSARINIH